MMIHLYHVLVTVGVLVTLWGLTDLFAAAMADGDSGDFGVRPTVIGVAMVVVGIIWWIMA